MNKNENNDSKHSSLNKDEISRKLTSLKTWLIDYDDLELQQRIGSGGYAVVYSGYVKSSSTVVAVKKLQNVIDSSTVEMFKREVETIADLKHFAILPFIGAVTSPDLCIVTEFMSGGSLYSRLHTKENKERLTPTQLSIIALGIAYGMEYLHGKQMIHRDLKSLNVLLDADNFPRICDFGMARIKGSSAEVMTGNVGTAQWMAPEILETQRYDEKADVYSFGIMLWEMLTFDVPFRGIQAINVAYHVVQKKSRPKIPKNCPQNLEKLICICWDQDPKVRPSFQSIVRALESGAISFPGTDISKLKTYVNQVTSSSQQIINELYTTNVQFEKRNISRDKFKHLLNSFIQNDEGILELISAVYDKDLQEYMLEKNIMPKLVNKLSECQDPHFASYIISFISTLLQNEEFISSFIQSDGPKIAVEILTRFYTSMIPKLVEILITSVENEKCIFNKNSMSRLAPFLVCSDLSHRQCTLKLISLIHQKRFYTDESDFCVFLDNIFQNAVIQQIREIVQDSIFLVETLSKFESVLTRLLDFIEKLIYLLEYPVNDVVLSVFRILQKLFNKEFPLQLSFNQFIEKVTTINTKANSRCQIEALNTIMILIKDPKTFKLVSEFQSFACSFVHLFSSKDSFVRETALKLCYVFCCNSQTKTNFSTLFHELCELLDSNKQTISLASYCIAAILSTDDHMKYLGENPKSLCKFLNDSLTSCNDFIEPALRIIGILASSIEGVKFLNKITKLENIVKLINSDNRTISQLAVMSIAALSSSMPDSGIFLDTIPLLFKHNCFEEKALCDYALNCISNSSIVPSNSVACIPYFKRILELLMTNEQTTKYKVLLTIHRIMSVPQAKSLFENEENIKILLHNTQQLWGNENVIILLEIFELLLFSDAFCRVLKSEGILEKLDNELENCSSNDIKRVKCIRIRSCILP